MGNQLDELNHRHQKQAQQIDILCNDMVAAHGDFSAKLSDMIFLANFYEQLLGHKDCKSLLNSAAVQIQRQVESAQVAIFLLQSEGFEINCLDDQNPIELNTGVLEQLFTLDVARQICRANWICSQDDLYSMGLNDKPGLLSQLSMAAIPLGKYSPGIGFILVYRRAVEPLKGWELGRLASITSGLSRAITAFCQSETAIN